MHLFVGLGNPGKKFSNNRHNIGFMAVEKIRSNNESTPWKSKFRSQVCEVSLKNRKNLLMKPDTFMNLSGEAVAQVVSFYKLSAKDITVFHDELDLPAGKYRCKVGGGHAGHKGLLSIHQHIGTNYNRVRMGIGRPEHRNVVPDYVLSNFDAKDQTWLLPLLEGIGRFASLLIDDDLDSFMQNVNLHIKGFNESSNI